MFSGYFTAASGILTQEKRLAIISNNVANMKTPGYHTQQGVTTTFDHEMMVRRDNGETSIGAASPISVLEEVSAQLEQGAVQGTGRFLDMAIEGEGFFTVRTVNADGEQTDLYTRNGNFNIDEEGYLYLRGAGRVMGQQGEIYVGTENIALLPNGEIHTDEGGLVDRLAVVIPPEDAVMRRFSNGLYTMAQIPQDGDAPQDGIGENEPVQAVAAQYYKMHQMSLEASNVDMNRETSAMIEAQRAFQACSAALKVLDGMNQKAANKIGSLS